MREITTENRSVLDTLIQTMETWTRGSRQVTSLPLSQAPISWRCTLQLTVELSTTEAEYMAMTEAIKETMWLQGL